ncbi:MAG: hypothetical protein ACKO34_03955 [Vampirovibrionales bacterium]
MTTSSSRIQTRRQLRKRLLDAYQQLTGRSYETVNLVSEEASAYVHDEHRIQFNLKFDRIFEGFSFNGYRK